MRMSSNVIRFAFDRKGEEVTVTVGGIGQGGEVTVTLTIPMTVNRKGNRTR